jgi:hypothetical protein
MITATGNIIIRRILTSLPNPKRSPGSKSKEPKTLLVLL